MNREVLKENQNQGWFSSATKKVTSDLIPWDRPLWTWPQNVSVPIWKPFKVQMKMEQKSIRIRKYSKKDWNQGKDQDGSQRVSMPYICTILKDPLPEPGNFRLCKLAHQPSHELRSENIFSWGSFSELYQRALPIYIFQIFGAREQTKWIFNSGYSKTSRRIVKRTNDC